MESLGPYLQEALATSREEFAKAHPHGWLVIQVASRSEHPPANGFATIAVERGAPASQLAAPDDAGLGYMALPIKKSDGPFQNAISVGRARNNDLVIRDGSVSKLHARLRIDDQGGHSLSDAGSTNGTKLNGTRLEVGSSAPLQSGDHLQLGGVLAIFLDSLALFDFVRALSAKEP